jgi:hypothetical protein
LARIENGAYKENENSVALVVGYRDFIPYPVQPVVVVPQNLIRAHGNAGDSPGRANAVDFESGKRRRDVYTALFLS